MRERRVTTYDSANYGPPAPVATVTVANPAASLRVSGVHLLIDSGADITLIPQHAISQLGLHLQPADQVEVAGFDGSRSFVQAVWIDVIFLKRIYRGRYLICDSEHGVLGRDILNHVQLVLDGPRADWSELTP